MIIKKYDKCLFLLAESFYKNFDLIYLRGKSLNKSISENFKIIDKFIKRLSDLGIQIYIPLIPKHFIYSDSNSDFFFDKDSKDILINKLNFRLLEKYNNSTNNDTRVFEKAIVNIFF